MNIHARSYALIPHLVDITNVESERAVTRYHKLRFKCGNCKKTITVRLPNLAKGRILPKQVLARVVTWYCLGEPPARILAVLRHNGINVSRSTVFRILQAAMNEDLKIIHIKNRHRHKNARDRGAPFVFFQGSDVSTMSGDFANAMSAPALVLSKDSKWGPGVVVVRSVVEIFKMYSDATSMETIRWISNFLNGFGNAGVRKYESKEALIRDVNPYKNLPILSNADDLVLKLSELEKPLDIRLPHVRNAIMSAMRIEEAPQVSFKKSFSKGMKFSNKWGFVNLGDVDNKDIYDDV